MYSWSFGDTTLYHEFVAFQRWNWCPFLPSAYFRQWKLFVASVQLELLLSGTSESRSRRVEGSRQAWLSEHWEAGGRAAVLWGQTRPRGPSLLPGLCSCLLSVSRTLGSFKQGKSLHLPILAPATSVLPIQLVDPSAQGSELHMSFTHLSAPTIWRGGVAI